MHKENKMARLTAVDSTTATGKAKQLLDAVRAKLKITPNMTKVMANSPAVLESYLSFSGALAGGALDAKLREQIALEVAELNGCEYCLSAHTTIGKMVGLNHAEIEAGRDGKSDTPKTAAALQFVRELVTKKGRLGNAEVEAVRKAGFNDGEIAELIANTVLNIFTNYFNNTTDVDIDFPKVSLRKAA
jgi:uncharacterized peroxidase-related enzyme